MVKSIAEYINYITQYGENVAFQWVDENDGSLHAKTYLEFVNDIYRCVWNLKNQWHELNGKHIAVCASNSYEYAVNAFGIMASGAVLVLMNNRNTQNFILEELELADVDYLVLDSDSAERYQNETVNYPQMLINHFEGAPCNSTLDVFDDERKESVFLFTSGTSGKSKCVMIKLGSLLSIVPNAGIILGDVDKGKEEKITSFYMMLPFYHISGFGELIECIFFGHQFNLCVSFKNIYRDLERMNSTYTCVVPMVFDGWFKALQKGQREKLGNIRAILCGGAGVDPNKVEVFAKHNIDVVLSYGMSETTGVGTHNLVNKSQKYNSIGRISSDAIEACFIDGEICLRGKTIMTGYYENQKETDAVLQDGWLHTGDMGYMDEEGYIYLTGRKKNLIILSSGENVSPEELEGLVSANEAVKEIVVKEKNGKICAEIFCDEDKQEEIRAFVTEVNRTLAMYKRMTLVEFREEPFPRTASGKIKRV